MAVSVPTAFRVALAGVALATVAVACTDTTAPTIEKTRFASSLGVNLAASTKTPSGLYYRDVAQGTGPAAEAGDSVSVAYELYNTNGSRWDAGTALRFRLAGPQDPLRMIAGFNEGVIGMKAGGQRQLVVPSHLGYGNVWDPGGRIPPNSILVFNVTLNAIYAD